MASSPQPGGPPLRGVLLPAAASSSSYYSSSSPVGQQQPPPTPPGFSWHLGAASGRPARVHGVGVVFALAVLSLVLFIAVLFLYSRWACRYRHMARGPRGGGSAASTTSDDDPGREPVSPDVVKERGLPQEAIDRLPVLPVTRRRTAAGAGGTGAPDQELQCPICLGGLTDVMKVLPGCRHGFHTDCVDLWLRLHASCPLCRASLLLDPLPLQAV